jgi:Methyltransferase domain
VSDDVERILAEQIRYYDDRAPEYEDLWFRRGRYDRGLAFNERWFDETAIAEAAVDAFAWSGTVLELACGSRLWTRRLAPRARRLVAVDSSPMMLERNRSRFGGPNVAYEQADLLAWEPGERFDAIFTGFFVSHIPPDGFAAFWRRVASWRAPGGAVFLVDDEAGPERPYSGDVVHGGPAFAHRRRLPGDREYTIVKVFYSPGSLTEAFDAVGWEAELRSTGEHFLYGTARAR